MFVLSDAKNDTNLYKNETGYLNIIYIYKNKITVIGLSTVPY